MIQVFVNDQELDLDPSTVIAITLQAADIGNGDLITRKASFTNQISVPKTSNNRTVLGVSDDIHSTDTFPFVINGVRVLSNGIEILSGNCELHNTAEKFNLRIYSVIKDLASTLGNKMLDELDFGDSPITWNASYWDGARASTSGLCAPVINYGQIDSTLANGTIGTVYLPSVSYKDILTQILLEAGYTIVSSDFYDNDTTFNNMVMTYGRHIWPGTSFKINEILPDHITQVDFVRDFAARFGAYFRFDEFDVEIITLEEILVDTANAIDWTDKRANDKFDLSYQWDGWAQKNMFNFPSPLDDEFLNDFGDEFYDGSIDSGNVNSPQSRTVFTSLFQRQTSTLSEYGAVSYQIASVGAQIYCATIPIWQDTLVAPTTYEFANIPEPMLCVLKDPEPDAGPPQRDQSIIYNVAARTDYKIAYFGNGPYSTFGTSMFWNGKLTQISSTQETGFLERGYTKLGYILETPKKVTRLYNLTDVDIYSLDLLVPIFDEGDYFLINQVKDYVPGRLTEVELLRIYYES